MTDVFRSEILAIVMQQIMDEPVLPVLFLRTASVSLRHVIPILTGIFSGHPSCDDIQVTRGLCVDNAALPANHEEDLDEPSPLGGIYSMRKGDCAGEFRSSSAVAQRPAA